jgi:hypothetical protein
MRSRKQPVIFVRVGFEPGYIDVLSRSARIDHLKEIKAMVTGEFGTEFPAGFSPLPSELVITKRALNPFHNTNLLGWLFGHGVERVRRSEKVTSTERYTTRANVFTGLAKALEGRPSTARDISSWLQHPSGPYSSPDPFPRARYLHNY